ncbi:juvenile hormone esterase-like isoform X2 [Bacillus rossius redtenbacheri]
MAEFVTVDIPQGRLRGQKVTSRASGATYYSFQGIPYAKPPVGPLRFKPPEDPEPWTGTRDALEEGAVCLQPKMRSNETEGSEDCLFLNVYTPQMPETTPKAVMVWIHGGRFMVGSGNTEPYGPDFLVAEDVILVTINYRMAAFGFLYLEGADVTGNNGLRDQVMALKWVRDNIAQFGGDPGNVTIFGQSAGGACVHYLMLAPLAAGLFHRAIAQSGTVSIGSRHISVEAANQRARRVAALLGCSSEDSQGVVDFLRAVPAERFVSNKARASAREELQQALNDAFAPSYEVGPDALLPDTPGRLLERGQFTKVPFMTGVTSSEGKGMALMGPVSSKLSGLEQDPTSMVPNDLKSGIPADKLNHVANLIKTFYFGEKQIGEDTIPQYIDLQSDQVNVFPMHRTVRLNTRWSPEPTYVYLFDYVGAPGFSMMPLAGDKYPGVAHMGELPFLFQDARKPSFPPGSSDSAMRREMVQLWTTFARTGCPTSDALNVTWLPATQDKERYLRIDGGFAMESDMFKSRMDFWDDLYDQFLPRRD